ncbi:ADAM17 peptidase (M12 family) [Schistosoma mansoni]|uniref:ADAM17 peptidase (M12 family) n=1 Tax=Schistosoma mansoni TaxID=6183 RepID=UPI0001A6253D|nr:ADAM17 peptidase (M12 family) [Schistosoma mansoni]|eukprot:XP_018649911.1 ADAM17 peptidase (M12 family) [Schistosoma mansoni]
MGKVIIFFTHSSRPWYLILYRETSFHNSNLSVRFISTNGTYSFYPKRKYAELHTGYVSGSNQSFVLAHLEPYTSLLSAHIHVESDIFVIEPLSDYINYIGNNSMLIYRLRDIQIKKILNNPMNYKSATLLALETDTFDIYIRRKRFNPAQLQSKLCRLTLIADYDFFTNLGNRNGPKTIGHVIKVFDRLNYLFLTSKFLDDKHDEMIGYGFLLHEIVIHESWTADYGHYNSPTDVGGKIWTATSLLRAFSRFDAKQSCLAHLLSYKRIDEGILGMSWLASPDPKKLGGICSSPVRRNNKKDLYLNTGWTTYVDYNGQQLVNALAELITAHELGHSWGADHDPDTDECNPTAISSGKYLMYTYSVSGYAENNGGEECDAGRNPHDPCCSSECYFRTGAHCSPWNHGCCTSDCQLAPKNTICAQTSSTNPCLGPGQCNGLSSICPGPTLLSGGQCDEHGRCFQGKCHPFCFSLGLETCICDSVEESCFICCLFPTSNSTKNQSTICLPVILTQNEYLLYFKQNTVKHSKSYSMIYHSKQLILYSMHKLLPFSSNILRLYDKHSLNDTYHFIVHNKSQKLPTIDLKNINSYYHEQPLVHIHLQDYRPCLNGYCMAGKCIESKSKRILRFWTPVHYSKHKNFGR